LLIWKGAPGERKSESVARFYTAPPSRVKSDRLLA
jgi:hypothetical protein